MTDFFGTASYADSATSASYAMSASHANDADHSLNADLVPMVSIGEGSPEGSTSGSPGFLYLQTDIAGIWQKTFGTGTTGWVLLLTSGEPASSSFTPSLDALVVWLEADHLDLSDDDSLIVWPNLSVDPDFFLGSETGSVVFKTSQINGLPAIQFNSGWVGTTDTVSVSDQYTLVMLFKVQSIEDTDKMFYNNGVYGFRQEGLKRAIISETGGQSYVDDDITTDYELWVGRFDGSISTLRINGVTHVSSSLSGPSPADNRRQFLATDAENGATEGNIDAALVLRYTQSLSDDVIAGMESDIAAKYGLTLG